MLRVLVAAAFFALSVTTVQAQSGGVEGGAATPQPTQEASAQPTQEASNNRQSTTGDPDRRICRTQTATGSRLGGKKVCKSAREWEAQRAGSKAELDRLQRPPATNSL